MAGSRVTAAKNDTAIPIARAGPTVENTPSLANLMPRKVIPTVAADAAITFPTDIIARWTARSGCSPSRTYS
ncbi:Uncharacterised protein [Mycobacterium tuberculosis]|nr:Uncharacterised protein [Mycobacterium tuberculosis]CFE66226.1 Uncharacterised protein [Mycobacterium tuberculosis]CKN85352.1 Uncharacterised protein [Mycobacterium tuberculosis]CKR06968.1 Uncharacterised protein [Mycobacterium tuberculosis]CKS56805.1 Uncharacterised protein [Mycobacterium tuberculosis]